MVDSWELFLKALAAHKVRQATLLKIPVHAQQLIHHTLSCQNLIHHRLIGRNSLVLRYLIPLVGQLLQYFETGLFEGNVLPYYNFCFYIWDQQVLRYHLFFDILLENISDRRSILFQEVFSRKYLLEKNIFQKGPINNNLLEKMWRARDIIRKDYFLKLHIFKRLHNQIQQATHFFQ